MKSLAIVVNDDLFKRVKIKIAENDLTLREYVTRLILADLEKDKEKSDT